MSRSQLLPVLVVCFLLAGGCAPGRVSAPPEPPGSAGPPAAVEPGPLLARDPLPTLSPDGELLLAVSEGRLRLFGLPGLDGRAGFDLGQATPVRTLWSPRGEAFVVVTEGPPAVYLGGLDGAVRRLAEGRRSPLAWSGDGRHLLLAHPLCVLDPAGGEIRAASLEETAEVRSPCFSPDGEKVYFTLFDPDAGEDLWVWDWRRGEPVRLTDDGGGHYPWAWWGEDRLVVEVGAVSTGGGHVHGLGVVDTATGIVTVLDRDQSQAWRPVCLAPRSDLVVYRTVHAVTGEDRRVLLKDLGGGADRTVAAGMTAEAASPLPDGSVVLLLRPEDGSWRLASYHVARDELSELAVARSDLHLLGPGRGWLYYLEAAAGGWLLRRVELP